MRKPPLIQVLMSLSLYYLNSRSIGIFPQYMARLGMT